MKNPLHSPRGTDNIVGLNPGPSPVITTANAGADPGRTIPSAGDSPCNSIIDPPRQPQGDDAIDIIDQPIAPVSMAEATSMELSPPQQTAIQLLTSGHTLVASATAAGVSRMTLHRWLKGDAAFSAAFNAWQKDVLDTARGRLLALTDLAVTTVAKSMSRGDARTAFKVLNSIGLLERAQPGSTDVGEIERQQNLERTKADTALRKAESSAELEACLTM